VARHGFMVKRADLQPASGVTSLLTKVATVTDRLDEAAAVKALVHELAQVPLHEPNQIETHAKRERCEVEAESVAYLVCAELGLASHTYSFPYVVSWSAGDMKVVTATADKVLACAGEIVAALEQVGTLVAA